MTDFTYDETIYSDLHKEVYGFRPREDEFYYAAPARKQEIWDALLISHEVEMQAYHEAQEASVLRFEQTVQKYREAGASDDETAIRWMLDSETNFDDHYGRDLDYVLWHFDLPFNFPQLETLRAVCASFGK